MGRSILKEVVLGLDVGKLRDYSALCGIERWQEYHDPPREHIESKDAEYVLKFLERFPLNTDYTDQVNYTKLIYDDAVERYIKYNIKQRYDITPQLVIDATGPGLPVLDQFKKVIPEAKGIYITGGFETRKDGAVYFVPKKDLVSNLQVIMQGKRIKFASNIPQLQTLQDELLTFQYKINEETGHASFEHWRERDHDDCVLSVACGLWYSERGYKRITGKSMEIAAQIRSMV